MLKKVTPNYRKRKDREIAERQAAGCLDWCLIICTGPGGNTYRDETAQNQCASPYPFPA